MGRGGRPEHRARGDWQLSRVYAVLSRPEPATHHAERCLQACEENGIGDFDLAFAYEALARSHALAGDAREANRYGRMAAEAGERIAEGDDRDLLLSELATISLGE